MNTTSQNSTGLGAGHPPRPSSVNGRARSALIWPVALAAFLTMIPTAVVVPVLKECVGDRYGASPLWTHSFMSVNMIGAILAMPLIAWLCDVASSRRKVVVAGLVADAALMAAMALAPTLPLLLSARFLEGIAHLSALSALMALAADLSDVTNRGRRMGFVGAAMMFGTALGTRLGGWVGQHGAEWSFFAASGAALIAAGFACLLPGASARVRPATWSDVSSVVRERRDLVVPYAYTFIERFCVGVLISTFVLFLGTVHGLSPDQRSRLLVMFLLPFAALIYPAGRLIDRFGPAVPLVGGSMSFGILFATYGLLPSSALPYAMIGSGVLSAFMFAPTLSLCAELAPAENRGAAFAGFNAAGSLGFLLGPLVGGGIVQALAPQVAATRAYQIALGFGGFAVIVCALVTLPRLLRSSAAVRARPSRPDAQLRARAAALNDQERGARATAIPSPAADE